MADAKIFGWNAATNGHFHCPLTYFQRCALELPCWLEGLSLTHIVLTYCLSSLDNSDVLAIFFLMTTLPYFTLLWGRRVLAAEIWGHYRQLANFRNSAEFTVAAFSADWQ